MGCGANSFDAYAADSRGLYRTPLLDSINSMMETLDGCAIVARGNFHPNTYRTGERDSTDDISEIARPDNIWSQCLIFSTAMLIKELIRRNIEVDIVDVYHDPKTLKRDHYEALAQALRRDIVSLARQFTNEQNIPAMQKLYIRRIEPVAKPMNDQPNQYQLGTRVADRLCALSGKSWNGEYSRIIPRDLSELVRRTTQQFDGKPFHSD